MDILDKRQIVAAYAAEHPLDALAIIHGAIADALAAAAPPTEPTRRPQQLTKATLLTVLRMEYGIPVSNGRTFDAWLAKAEAEGFPGSEVVTERRGRPKLRDEAEVRAWLDEKYASDHRGQWGTPGSRQQSA